MITPIFPVPLYTNSGVDVSGVSDYLKTLEYRRVGSDNGFCTTDQQILNHEQLLGLRNQILAHISEYVTELRISPNYEFYINCSWGMYHDKGDWAHSHDHSNSLISGVVYVDVDENSGAICFHRDWQTIFPNAINPQFTEDNALNSNQARFLPENGQVVLFPSHVMHSVEANMSDITRRCIAFNVFIKGVINDNSDNRMSYLEI